jgi:predicted nucleic-acid-binding protein
VLRDAEIMAVTAPALCEFAWVLIRGYCRAAGEVIGMIRSLLESAAVRTDRPAIEARPAMLAAGGDFADGIVAFESRRLGGVVFTELRPHGGRIDCHDRRRDAREAGRWR